MRTVQLKHRLALLPQHMHVRRSMIIGIDDDPELFEMFDGWHFT